MSAPHDEPVDEPCVYLTRNGAMSPAVCHAFLDWREAPVAPRPSEAELSFLDPVRMRCFSSSPYPARLRCLSSAPYLAMPDPCRYTRKQRAGAAQATSGGVLGAYALSSSENEEEEVHPPVALVADIEEGEIVEVTPVHSVGSGGAWESLQSQQGVKRKQCEDDGGSATTTTSPRAAEEAL